MGNNSDNLFDPQSKPFRRDASVKITFDEEGNPIVNSIEREVVMLSPEGSIDRAKISRDWFFHCGCSGQVTQGGQCGEPGCSRINCVNCFGRCQSCSKPLCLEHSRFLTDGAQRIRLCDSCRRRRSRMGLWHTLLGIFLKPTPKDEQ